MKDELYQQMRYWDDEMKNTKDQKVKESIKEILKALSRLFDLLDN